MLFFSPFFVLFRKEIIGFGERLRQMIPHLTSEFTGGAEREEDLTTKNWNCVSKGEQ